MFRRISTKLVLAVLAAVALPFLGFAWFVDAQMSQELSLKVVLQNLLAVTADLSGQVDHMVEERNLDVALWADSVVCEWAITDLDRPEIADAWGAAQVAAYGRGEFPAHAPPRGTDFRALLTKELDGWVERKGWYDLILVVNHEGRLVSCNSQDAAGAVLDTAWLEDLFARDYSAEAWFQQTALGLATRQDWHVSPYVPHESPFDRTDVDSYHVAFAAPVRHFAYDEEVVGAVYALVSWQHLQDLVRAPVIKDFFRGLVTDTDRVPSPYAWIWASDCDTIIAHEKPELYGERVSGPAIGLPSMVEDARRTDFDLYREYTFRGNTKNAAFKHTRGAHDGGFGWVVGVGIDNDDIYAHQEDLSNLLIRATVAVLLVVVLWTMIIARHTTQPILALQEHTRRVAEGDLDARVEIQTRDEVGELAYAFNQMTRELGEQRDQLVKAEKDAAWREMARQIAHDIKNQLTPIKLSLDLLERARADEREDLDEIIDRTSEMMRRQVDNLREIATDFYEFTGGRKPELVDLDAVAAVDEVLELNHAWADELGVEVRRDGPGATARADAGKLQRVLTNLVSNALQAMPRGGELEVHVAPVGGRVAIEVRDTGRGLDEETRKHLFEPYFTTRSEGTGLGLAIAKRVLEEMDGTVELEPRASGQGTIARVTLPRAAGVPG